MRSAGEATRERILDAARSEFARYGIAGARVNRIASEARASKERLYAYFANKEDLFAAVSGRWVTETAAETALRGDDLPAYAGRLFDNFIANPHNVRLQRWADLEETTRTADDSRVDAVRSKVREIRRGQQEGFVDDSWDAVELLVMVTDVVLSLAVGHSSGSSARRRTDAARRADAVEAVRRIIAPPSS
ncbi:MAG: TetR family transcriptional regulator [Rhodococcus sp. (in: high G+C Gram-positive bacteria)]